MDALKKIENTLGIDYSKTKLEQIHHPVLNQKEITLFVKRDDLLHPIISGNKWRKLKYIIHHALELGLDHLVSMGGAYSNHLHALAFVCHKLNIKCTAFIRGEENDNPTINDLKHWGMKCVFIERSQFRELRSLKNYNSLNNTEYSGYWIPEGGATSEALLGINELLEEITLNYDFIATACGTGTTLAGLSKRIPPNKKLIGISALKNTGFIETEIKQFTSETYSNFEIFNDYHFGGFAKSNPELVTFIKHFTSQTNIPIEPVYTGKLFFGLFNLVQKNYFQAGQTIIAYHSGGLQGAR